MNSLVTGATGFVGGLLVDALLRHGGEVNYAGSRRSPKLDGRAAFHCWNRNADPPLDSVPRLDAIFHLAGEPISQRWTPEIKTRILQSRVDGTRRLVSAIGRLRHKPSVLISSSAVGFYGDRGEEVLTEASSPGNGFLADVCVQWEREALRAREFGLRVVLVRIAMVLGKEGGAFPKMLVPFRLGIGGRFGSGKQWTPWVHIDDLVSLLLFAAQQRSVEGPINACSPQLVTNAQFTDALGLALRRPAFMPVPRFALRVALGELAAFVLASQRVLPEVAERNGFVFHQPDLLAAIRSLV